MKFLLGLLLMAGGMGAAFYYSGAFHSPKAECEKTMAEVKDCSTMAEVLDVAEPHKVSIYQKEIYTFSSGRERVDWVPGPEVDFNKARMEQQVEDGSLEGGFAFIYIYSNSDSFEAKFDSTGKLQFVHEQTGVRNLPGN